MQQRTLTITVDANPRQALRARAVAAFQADGYLGETLNFETPGAFFGRLTERRWALVQMLMGAGELSSREPMRRLGRDSSLTRCVSNRRCWTTLPHRRRSGGCSVTGWATCRGWWRGC